MKEANDHWTSRMEPMISRKSYVSLDFLKERCAGECLCDPGVRRAGFPSCCEQWFQWSSPILSLLPIVPIGPILPLLPIVPDLLYMLSR